MAASYEIYFKNYKDANGIKTTEKLFQTIPVDDDGTLFMEPSLKNEIGKASTFEFELPSESVYYSGLIQMKTIFRVEYFGKTVFKGRVLTIDDTMMEGIRKIHCEGDFAYFMDSQQEGVKDEKRPKISVLQYLTDLIDVHNEQMNDPDKTFYIGEVPGNYTSASDTAQRVVVSEDRDFGDASWGTTMDRLEDLVDKYGGYFRTRYEDGKTYLDWLEQYYDANPGGQSIEIRKNIIEIESETEVDNLFTVVIPIGSGGDTDTYINAMWPSISPGHAAVNYIEVPELATIPLYSDSELNKGIHKKSDYQNAISDHGRIYKTVRFDNASTPSDLFKYAKDWILNNYIGEITSYDVTAIDLSLISGQYDPLYVGDLVTLVVYDYDSHDLYRETMTVISVEKKLLSPEEDNYKIGKPNSIINQVYGNKNSKSKGGGGGGVNDPPTVDTEIYQKVMDAFNQKMMGNDITYDNALAFLCYDEYGHQLSVKQFTKNLTETFTPFQLNEFLTDPVYKLNPEKYIHDHPDLESKYATWQMHTITNLTDMGIPLEVAGMVVSDSSQQALIASYVDDEGNSQVGPLSPAFLQLAVNCRESINNRRENLLSMTLEDNSLIGSVQQLLAANGMTVPGIFSVDLGDKVTKITKVVNELLPGVGENLKTLFSFNSSDETAVFNSDVDLTLPEVVKRVKNGVAFGIYDEENLTAGVIVTKINDDTTVMLKGDHIQIGSTDAETAILDLNSSVINIGSDISSISDTLANQETLLSDHGHSITALTNDVTLIGGELTQAQFELAEQGRSITAINSAVTSITSQITTIGGDLTQAQSDLLAHESELAGHAVSITAINSNIVDITGQLNAAKARIGTLESDAITTTNLGAKIAELGSVSVHGLTASAITTTGSVNIGMGLTVGGTLTVNGNGVLTSEHDPLQTFEVDVSTDGETVTLTWKSIYGTHNGSKSFSKAGAVSLSGSWSGNTYTVTASPSGITESTAIRATTTTDGTDSKVTILEVGKTNVLLTHPIGTVFVSGRNDGWEDAYALVSLPAGSMSSSFTVKTPPSTVDGAAITTAYAIQDPVINGENSYIQVKNSSGTVVASKTIGNVYKAGWDAVDSGFFNYEYGLNGSYPNKTVNVKCTVTLENDKSTWNQYDSGILSGWVNDAYTAGAQSINDLTFDVGSWSITSGSGASAVVSQTLNMVLNNGVRVTKTIPGADNVATKIYRSAYSSGKTAGEAAGKEAVTLQGSWSGATYTATASNDKKVSTTLTPSPANASTISTFTNHKATITVATQGISGPLFHWTVDTTSEYNAGYNAGLAAGKAAMGLVRNGNSISLLDGSSIKKFTANYSASKHTAGTLNWTNVRQTTGAGVAKSGNTVRYSSSSVYASLTASIDGDEYTPSSFSWSFYT